MAAEVLSPRTVPARPPLPLPQVRTMLTPSFPQVNAAYGAQHEPHTRAPHTHP